MDQDYENTKITINNTEENPFLRKEKQKFFQKNKSVNKLKLSPNIDTSNRIRDQIKIGNDENILFKEKQAKSSLHNFIQKSTESIINLFFYYLNFYYI